MILGFKRDFYMGSNGYVELFEITDLLKFSDKKTTVANLSIDNYLVIEDWRINSYNYK